MIRSRLTVASLSAVALGLAAVLVPTASVAEPVVETPAASARVIWADATDDFAYTELADGQIELADEWRWTAPLGAPSSSLADFGTFGENGFTANGSAPVAFVHGVAPVSASEAEAFIEDSATNAGEQVLTGVFVMVPDSESPIALPVQTLDGLRGAETQWSFFGEGEPLSTPDFAAALEQLDAEIAGYFAIFPGQAPTLPEVPEEPEVPQEEPTLELLAAPEGLDDAPTFEELLTAQGTNVSLRAAVPAAAGIASFRIGDLTTYFTPQPTATLTLGSTTITVAQATTTGFTVTGSGFAPGEIVTSGIGTGAMGDSLPDTFVADADGNVSGTIVLPAAWAAAGEYSIALIGASSGQVAGSALAITGAAPVAVPVPGEATYTG